MIKIIDKKSSGKTSRLLLLAKENKGIIVCSNPQAMRYKAKQYGFEDIQVISYEDFIKFNYPEYTYYIDEIDKLLWTICPTSAGYTISLED